MSLQYAAWLLAVGFSSLVPGSGEKGTRLSRLEARGTGTASRPSFSPDGAALFFTADMLVDDFPQLFSVPANLRTEPEAVSLGSSDGVWFSRDGRWLAYNSEGPHVRAVAARGAGRRLTSTSTSFVLTPDSTRVVYWEEGLRCAPLDGATLPLLLAPSSPGAALYVTPDSTRVVYYSAGFHSVPLDASSAPLQLTGPIAELASEVEISADSSWLLYAQSRASNVGMPTEWFSVPVAGGTPVQLTVPLDPALQVIGFHVQEPGSARFVYKVLGYVLFPQGPAFTSGELRSAPLDGGPGSLLVGSGLPSYVPSPLVGAGGWLVYTSIPAGSSRPELFRQQADGSGVPKLLNTPLPPGASVHAFALTPDGTRVLYVADQEVVDVLPYTYVHCKSFFFC